MNGDINNAAAQPLDLTKLAEIANRVQARGLFNASCDILDWIQEVHTAQSRAAQPESAIGTTGASIANGDWGAVHTVGDMVRNLLTLDQSAPIFTAFHVTIDGERRCRTRGITISRERVIDGKWIDSSRKDVPYANVVWAKQDERQAAPASAQPADLERDYQADYQYMLGLRAGWNLSQQRDVEGFNAALVARQACLDDAKRDLSNRCRAAVAPSDAKGKADAANAGGLTDDECDRIAAETMDRVAAAKNMHALEISTDIKGHWTLRRELIRAGAAAASQSPATSAAAVPDALYQSVKDMQDAAYTFGDNCQEAVRVALDGVLDAMREIDAETATHPDDAAVDRFAAAMKVKMAASRAKGRGGWDNAMQCPAERLQAMLNDHLAKGDPVDVGNFAMMLWNRGERTATSAADAKDAEPDMLWLSDDNEVFAHGPDEFAEDYACECLRPGEEAEVDVDCATRAGKRTMRIALVPKGDEDDCEVVWKWVDRAAMAAAPSSEKGGADHG